MIYIIFKQNLTLFNKKSRAFIKQAPPASGRRGKSLKIRRPAPQRQKALGRTSLKLGAGTKILPYRKETGETGEETGE